MTPEEYLSFPSSQRSEMLLKVLAGSLQVDSATLLGMLVGEPTPQLKRQLESVISARQAEGAADAPRTPTSERAFPTYHTAPHQSRISHAPPMDSLIRHELTPNIGRMKLWISREIDQYERSETWLELGRLERQIDRVSGLLARGRPLMHSEFSLKTALKSACDEVIPGVSPRSAPKDDPFIRTDAALFMLFLQNALRNAARATPDPTRVSQIVVEYGSSSGVAWLKIVNEFAGDSFSLENLAPYGSSTSGPGRGVGLSLMSEIATRLEMEFSLWGTSGIATTTCKFSTGVN